MNLEERVAKLEKENQKILVLLEAIGDSLEKHSKEMSAMTTTLIDLQGKIADLDMLLSGNPEDVLKRIKGKRE